jgi:hypothetical protein
MLLLEVFAHLTRPRVGFMGRYLDELLAKMGSYGKRLREDLITKHDGLIRRLKTTLARKPASELPEFVRVCSWVVGSDLLLP